MSDNLDIKNKQEYIISTRGENVGCAAGIFGAISFITGMIVIFSVDEDGSIASKVAAIMIICGIILFIIGVIVASKISKKKAEIYTRLEIQKKDLLMQEYHEKKKRCNIPKSAVLVKYTRGYAEIDRVNQYLWIDNSTMHFFPEYSIVTLESSSKILEYKIPLNKIEYFAIRGEIVHENKISGGGGGGSSVGGAIVGGMIAGGAGAVIGSRKEAEPIKSELITHDKRETFLNFFDDNNVRHSMFFDYKDYSAFNDLIPEKAFNIVNTIKTNNVLSKVINENSAKTITDQIRELAELKDEGILTDEEFISKKEELLKRI